MGVPLILSQDSPVYWTLQCFSFAFPEFEIAQCVPPVVNDSVEVLERTSAAAKQAAEAAQQAAEAAQKTADAVESVQRSTVRPVVRGMFQGTVALGVLKSIPAKLLPKTTKVAVGVAATLHGYLNP